MNTKKTNRKIKILITGDQDYKSKNNVIDKLEQIVMSFDMQKVSIATFNDQYGPQKTVLDYCEKKGYPVKFFTKDDVWFSPTLAQVNILMYVNASKWADLVIIFSNVYTFKIKKIIQTCKGSNKDYIIIKE